MGELKTKKNEASVEAFLDDIEDPKKREDAYALLKIFTEITKEKAVMWGEAMIGFGSYHYKSNRSTQEGDWFLTGFSPRKQNISIYIIPGFEPYKEWMEKLGKYKATVSCLYVKRLSDIDLEVLKKIIKDSVDLMKKKYT